MFGIVKNAGGRVRTCVGTKPTDDLRMVLHRTLDEHSALKCLESVPFGHSGTPADIV